MTNTHTETPSKDIQYPITFLCVDKLTSIIYEAQPINDFVMLRPATPSLYGRLTRLTFEEFTEKFEEFDGNLETIKQDDGNMYVSFKPHYKPQSEKK